jgi:hypothetical protein
MRDVFIVSAVRTPVCRIQNEGPCRSRKVLPGKKEAVLYRRLDPPTKSLTL